MTITASWLYIGDEAAAETDMQAADYAIQDLRDIDACDVCILFNPEGYSQSPGRNIEFGYALAKGKALWIVGKRKGVFQCLPQVRQFANIEDLQHYLSVWNDPQLFPYKYQG